MHEQNAFCFVLNLTNFYCFNNRVIISSEINMNHQTNRSYHQKIIGFRHYSFSSLKHSPKFSFFDLYF